jgi:signal transduction histidine kinase
MNAVACRFLLDRPHPDLHEIRRAMAAIVGDCERADQVIRRNSELFRHRKVEKIRLDVNSVIHEVAGFLRARLQAAQVALSTTLEIGLPAVFADRIELQQVLINLIANGLDAMEHVDARSRRLDVTSALHSPDSVRISVRDTGIGLKGVDTAMMFAPSYTTKVHGTGVGLWICRSIVEAHDGRLWAEDHPSGGATFSFTLPLHPAAVLTAPRQT